MSAPPASISPSISSSTSLGLARRAPGRAAAAAPGRRRAGPPRRSCIGSSAAGWSQTLQLARSSAVQMPITGRLHAPHHRINRRRRRQARTGASARGGDHERADTAARDRQPARRTTAAATVELNRPQALNAWNAQFGADLLAALRGAPRDDAVRAVVITGAGRGFSSGADLKDISGGDTTADGRPDVYRTLTERYHPIMKAIREMPKPVLAAVNGPAVGHRLLAGAVLRSDPRGRERLLPARVRQHRPRPRRRLLAVRARPASAWRAPASWRCSASALPAQRALEWGLINRVVADERLRERDRGAGGAAGGGPDALLRGHQAPAQQLALRAHGRAARARGADPAGDGRQRGLPRGRDGVRREAPARCALGGRERRVEAGSWQSSSSASRPA